MHDHKVHTAQLRKDLYKILNEVENGETVLVERQGRVVARISPVTSRAERLQAYWGQGERQITTVADEQLREENVWKPEKLNDL